MLNKNKEYYLLLHNVRSVYNVGSIFRTADAGGVTKIFLTGYTPTPVDRFGRERKDLAKVSLGAEKSVAWEYSKTPTHVLRKLKKEGVFIIALEQSEDSRDYRKIKSRYPFILVCGNEVRGLSKQALELVDIIAEIPMRGKKESLNVSVAVGISLFGILK